MHGFRGQLKQAVADFRIALNFLTRLPGGAHTEDPAAIARALRAAPAVGALTGAIGAAIWLVAQPLGPWPAALCAVSVQLLATGAFHEDGWADFWDALGGRDQEERLAIMRDSRLGAYGGAALILALALKAACLAETSPRLGAAPLIAAGAMARDATAGAAAWLPPARTDGLVAQAGAASRRVAWTAALLAALVSFAALGPPRTVAAILAAGSAVLALGLFARRQFGGRTGDVLGAMAVAAEIAVLASAAWTIAP